MEEWYVYILGCVDESLYIGTTNDIEKRVAKHNAGKGAKYTKGRTPVKVLYSACFNSRSEACAEEYKLKKYSRQQKLALIKNKIS